MSLLSPSDQEQLRDAFAALTSPVTVVFFSQAIGCETCDSTRQILREVTDLTDRITVQEANMVLEKERAEAYGVERVPALVLLAGEERTDTRIRFLGAPEGWDFLSFVDALLAAGGASPQTLTAESLEKIGELTEDVALHVFVTPT